MSEEYAGRKFKTVFVASDFEADPTVVSDLVRTCRILDSVGMGPENSGNVSIRVGGGMIIKAGGISLGEVSEENIVYVSNYDEKENKAEVAGKLEPSSETPMHWMIYKTFPEINAVVHAHDPTLLKSQGKVESLGITSTAGGLSYGTLTQAKDVVEKLNEADYVFITGHGSVSVGKDVLGALDALLKVHMRVKGEGSN